MTTTEQSIREALEYAQTSTNIPGMAKHHIYTLCQLLERQTESKHAAGSSIPDALILEDEPEPDSKETIAYINGWNDFRDHVLKALNTGPTSGESFQERIIPWLVECFGHTIASDTRERNQRFLEEALELVQSLKYTQAEAHQMVEYVYGRPAGDPPQEVGGVMVTLAALCQAASMDMHDCAEIELARIWTNVDVIREKQRAKPQIGPQSEGYPDRPPANTSSLAFVLEAVRNERVRQDGKWGGPEHDDTNSPAFFVQLIQDYAGWARVMIGMNSPDKYRRRMIQVAALAVASVESLDRTQNRSPNQEG